MDKASLRQRRDGRAAEAAEVVRCLRRLFRAIHEYSKAIHRSTGLSAPQVWALTLLRAEPQLSLRELATRMFAHPSTTSGIVERLVERGAVRRSVNRKDRREVRLCLTPLGRRVLRRSPSPVQSGLRQALQSMPSSRLHQLRLSLEQIVSATESGRIDAPFFELA